MHNSQKIRWIWLQTFACWHKVQIVLIDTKNISFIHFFFVVFTVWVLQISNSMIVYKLVNQQTKHEANIEFEGK